MQASQRNRRELHIQLILRITFKIGIYPSEKGYSESLGRFKQKSEKHYQYDLKCIAMKKRSSNKAIKRTTWKTLSFFQGLNGMIKKFLKTLRSYGGVVNSAVAIAVADALVQRYPEYNFNHIQFRNRSRTSCSFKKMNLFRRPDTTGKIQITEGAREEAL